MTKNTVYSLVLLAPLAFGAVNWEQTDIMVDLDAANQDAVKLKFLDKQLAACC
jgi:hypothetical protein